MEIAPEIMSSMESLNEDAKNYTVNVKRFTNGAEIVDMMESASLNQLLNSKRMNVMLKVEVLPLKKIGPKKKKQPVPYTINSFIFYTSFLSKAGIKLKKDSKSWQCMGLNPNTKEPIDLDGHNFRKLIAKLEAFHKKLFVFDDPPTNKVLNVEKTDYVRKRAIAYSQNLLAACYNNEPVEQPQDDNSKEIYKYLDVFKTTVEKFKSFLVTHKFLKSDEEDEDEEEEEEVPEYSEDDERSFKKASRVTKGSKTKNVNNTKLTFEMVNDMIDNELIG
ncbi:ORF51 [Agrotis segetum granulovirus]|uniref:39k protein n=1 Tax=Agrotis segetum granulosis virus TaxID=10464 RepID=Q6QXJ4_GVAS|nr:pp31 [Agrotis segetum granulovirus]AAS82687.1 ORF51 [Agrotis segetum granulovirus]AHN92099.1 39k protein [Agrotis segetum granulovirus]AKN63334.1 pp31 [Agrotis segetum granulovirus]